MIMISSLLIFPIALAQVSSDMSIYGRLSELGKSDLSTFYQAINDSGFIDTLKSSCPITIFAPSNEAFAKISSKELNEIMENRERLKSIIAYHIVPEDISSYELKNRLLMKTYQGEDLTISTSGDTIKVNNATIKQSDIKCNNGVIHIIDTLLIPKESQINGTLKKCGVVTMNNNGIIAIVNHNTTKSD